MKKTDTIPTAWVNKYHIEDWLIICLHYWLIALIFDWIIDLLNDWFIYWGRDEEYGYNITTECGEQILIEDWQTDKQDTWESDFFLIMWQKNNDDNDNDKYNDFAGFSKIVNMLHSG